MEIRLLRYFLAVAQEGSIIKASSILHITQPTLSRQIKALEQELGTILFNRENNMELTSAGEILKDRAYEILQLVNGVEKEFKNESQYLIKGNIKFGCIEGTGSEIFSELVSDFHVQYPLVTYDIFTGTGDDITDRIDKGILDLGIVLEPISLNKYNSIPFKQPEPWGVLVNRNQKIASLETVSPKELENHPLFIPGREPIQQKITQWFDKSIDELNIIGHYKLLSNVALLVEKEVGISISTQSAALHYQNEKTKFIPFAFEEESDSLLIWKKNRILTPTVEKFIENSSKILSFK